MRILGVPPSRRVWIFDLDNTLHDASHVSYGWGMIPVTARIGGTEWATSLWPKDGRYIVPVRADVRRAEGVDDGDTVTVGLDVRAEI